MLYIFLSNQLFLNICSYDIMALITCLGTELASYWLHDRGSIPRKATVFYFRHNFRTNSTIPPAYYKIGKENSSSNIIIIIKTRRMGWAGHVGSREMHIGYWWKIQKEGDN
jgi:hypothetical protein